MAASLACIALLNLAAWGLMADRLPRDLTLILSAALLFGPFETIVHWFEARIDMKPVAIARTMVSLLAGTARLTLIVIGAGLLHFAWLVPLEALAAAILLLLIYQRYGLSVRDWKADAALIHKFIRQGAPLFFSALAVMTYMRIDQVMLGRLSTPADVGVYAAAARISEMFYFVPVLLSGLLFPYLIKFDKRGHELFERAFQLMCDGFAWMALLIAAGVSLFSAQIVALAYGEAYRAAAPILVIHVWAGVFVFVEALRSKWFVIRQITQFQLVTTAIGAVLNVLLNLYLIPRYQGYGAAVATTLSYSAAAVFSCFLHRQTWAVGTILMKSLFAPLRILETLRTFAHVRAAIDGHRS
jgi:O-antigen/teichoic acid export membrane protein